MIKHFVILSVLTLISGQAFAAKQSEVQLPSADPEVAHAEFEASMRQRLPVLPDQLREARDRYNKMLQAEALPTPTAKPKILDIDLDPLRPADVIHISPNQVTTCVVVDITGEAWPIAVLSVADGEQKRFTISQPEGYGPQNIVVVSPQVMAGSTNFSLMLKGINIPLRIQLATTLDAFNDSVILRLNKRGPNASVPMIGESINPTSDSKMMRVADGLPPSSSALPVDINGMLGWKEGDALYVRAGPQDTIYTPYTKVQRGVNGARAYLLGIDDVLMVERDGAIEYLSVKSKLEGSY